MFKVNNKDTRIRKGMLFGLHIWRAYIREGGAYIRGVHSRDFIEMIYMIYIIYEKE